MAERPPIWLKIDLFYKTGTKLSFFLRIFNAINLACDYKTTIVQQVSYKYSKNFQSGTLNKQPWMAYNFNKL